MSAEREPNSSVKQPASNGAAMTAAIIAGDRAADEDAPERSYVMFHVRDISPEGAFFAGSLFLELNEEFTAELSLNETTKLRVRARVVSLDYSDAPGMNVTFSELSADDRELITAQRAAQS